MNKKAKLIKVLKDQVLYSLSSTAALSDKFIDGLDWPGDKATLVFKFPEKEAGRGLPVPDSVSRKKYVCRLVYMAEKSEIPAAPADGAACGLELAGFKNAAEHRKWALATDLKYFSRPFRAYLTPGFKAEAGEYYRKELPRAKGVCVRRKGKIVSMLTLLKIAGKAGAGPLDWVSWIWVDPRLPGVERRCIHALLRGWLRENGRGRIGASVHAANIKSQKWFLRSGFRPARLCFTRRALKPVGKQNKRNGGAS